MNNAISTPGSLDLIEKYAAALRSADHSAMEKLRSPDFKLDWVHSDAFADQPLDQESVSQFWLVWFGAFSEFDYEITRTIAAESIVVTQWTFTGTHDKLLGIPVFDPPLDATGKTIRLRGVSVFDIEGELIVKETMYIDLATLWVELGVKR